ncbi:MAG: hypothetical protein J7599_20580 [Niabella sp.]|nr:hypothetical protein [Niabella sp.]
MLISGVPGVYSPADLPTRITFRANVKHAPYNIRTKPIHTSQKLVSTANGWTTFTIEVIPDFELERELLGFGEGLHVVAPRGSSNNGSGKCRSFMPKEGEVCIAE